MQKAQPAQSGMKSSSKPGFVQLRSKSLRWNRAAGGKLWCHGVPGAGCCQAPAPLSLLSSGVRDPDETEPQQPPCPGAEPTTAQKGKPLLRSMQRFYHNSRSTWRTKWGFSCWFYLLLLVHSLQKKPPVEENLSDNSFKMFYLVLLH